MCTGTATFAEMQLLVAACAATCTVEQNGWLRARFSWTQINKSYAPLIAMSFRVFLNHGAKVHIVGGRFQRFGRGVSPRVQSCAILLAILPLSKQALVHVPTHVLPPPVVLDLELPLRRAVDIGWLLAEKPQCLVAAKAYLGAPTP